MLFRSATACATTCATVALPQNKLPADCTTTRSSQPLALPQKNLLLVMLVLLPQKKDRGSCTIVRHLHHHKKIRCLLRCFQHHIKYPTLEPQRKVRCSHLKKGICPLRLNKKGPHFTPTQNKLLAPLARCFRRCQKIHSACVTTKRSAACATTRNTPDGQTG